MVVDAAWRAAGQVSGKISLRWGRALQPGRELRHDHEYRRGSIIDMSRAAARELDMIDSGTTMVSAVRQ
jgi:hypothetical protein